MADNRIKGEKKKTLFTPLEQMFGANSWLRDGLPVQYFIRVLFFFSLALIYIWNSHYAEKTIRNISRLEKEVEDLRADYTTMKAEFMLSGKQSEIARRVKPLGLEESLVPPQKIIIKE